MTTWPDDAVERMLDAFYAAQAEGCVAGERPRNIMRRCLRAALIAAGSPPPKTWPTREHVARIVKHIADHGGIVDVEKTADAILALFAQAGSPGGWQPIESAPRNGMPILAVVDGDTRVVQWGKTSHVPLHGFCLADQGAEDFDLCEPTHWQPLPTPPEEPQ